MSALGALVVKLSLDYAEYTKGLDKGSQEALKFAQNQEKAFNKTIDKTKSMIGNVVAMGAAYLSVNAIMNSFMGAVNAADKLNDLRKSTSLTIEELSGLSLASKQSGSDLEGVAQSFNKLSVNIGKNPDKFRELGISAKDPLEAFKQLADIFVQVKDPQDRAALGAAALGKQWSTAAPLLMEGGKRIGEMVERGAKLAGVTKEMAENADEFNDQMAELSVVSQAAKNRIVADLLPGLIDATKAIKLAYEESGKLTAAWVALGAVGAFLFTDEFAGTKVKIENANRELNDLYGRRNDAKGNAAVAAVTDMAGLDAKIAAAEGRIASLKKSAEPKAPEEKPKVDEKLQGRVRKFNQGDSKKEGDQDARATAKKQVEDQLRMLESGLSKERDIIQFDAKYKAEMYSQDLITAEAFFDSKKKEIDDNLAAISTASKKEIEILEKSKAASKKPQDAQDYQNKINLSKEKVAKAELDAMQDSKFLLLERQRAQNRLNADMKEWVYQQEQSVLQGQFEIEMMGKTALEAEKLTAARRIELDVEEKIRKARKEGTLDEAKLAEFRAAAAKAAVDSQAVIQAKYDRSQDPWLAMTDSLRKYGEEASNVGKNISDAMTNSLKKVEDTTVDFVMTSKFNFNSLANYVIQEFVRVQVKASMASATGGLSNFFASLFDSQNQTDMMQYNQNVANGIPNAKGNAFYGGNVIPFARGGAFSNSIASRPTLAPMALFGEAGPEAIMPLSRGADGSLGVRASGGGNNINVKIINNAQAKVTAKPSADGNGIDVLIDAIDSAIGDRIGAGIGSTNSAMQSRYGLRAAMGG